MGVKSGVVRGEGGGIGARLQGGFTSHLLAKIVGVALRGRGREQVAAVGMNGMNDETAGGE